MDMCGMEIGYICMKRRHVQACDNLSPTLLAVCRAPDACNRMEIR